MDNPLKHDLKIHWFKQSFQMLVIVTRYYQTMLRSAIQIMPDFNRKVLVKKSITLILLISLTFSVLYKFKPQKKILVSERNIFMNKEDLRNISQPIKPTQDGDPYLIPRDEVLQGMSERDLLRIYWPYVNSVQILCGSQIRIGHLGDGGKEICVDPEYMPQRPCIVYSFGSNFQFDFDLAMHDHYGCEVFTYDPSKEIKGQVIPKGIKFELRGLAGRDYINDKQWRMSTLESIMRDNGHLNKTIDVIKIDVEGSEWEALPPFIQTGLHNNVKQILIEVHVGRTKFKTLWGETKVADQMSVLRQLYESGFRIFQHDRNLGTILSLEVPPSHLITTCNEISLINMKYDK